MEKSQTKIMTTVDEHRKEMAARGAIEVSPETAKGFQEDTLFQDLAEDLQKEVEALIVERQHDIKSPAQHVELASQWHEENQNLQAVRNAKWLFQTEEELTKYYEGRTLTGEAFLQLLKKIRNDAELADFTVLGRRGLYFTIADVKTYITTIQDGLMIEWSQMRTDAHQIPTNEKYRGWRTVLLTLIERHIISEEECDKVFGKPTGPRAKRWNRLNFSYRNGYCPECGYKACECKSRYDYMRADNYAYRV